MTGTQTLTLGDGRRLAWFEAGKASGPLVFAFHGLPGSREQRHPDERLAERAGVRLIHVERPGFGLSDPRVGRSFRDWASDISELADYLRADQFRVAGVSGGGPFALACAAYLPDRVERLALVSSVGPPGSMNQPVRMLGPARLGFTLARHAPWMLTASLVLFSRLVLVHPRAFIAQAARDLGGRDLAILADESVRQMLVSDLREALRQGANAMRTELGLLASDWNLPFSAVRASCSLWHGERDRLVPAEASRYLAKHISNSRLMLLPEEGHFLVLDHWPEILTWLVG
jgi:pimeloyl-ACP methyl ester carboxylesterase